MPPAVQHHPSPRRGETPKKSPWLSIISILLGAILVVLYWQIKTSGWDEELPLTIVVAGADKLGLVQLDPKKQTATLLSLPDNLLLDVAGVGSQYQAKTLWRFGEVEGKPGEIVQGTVAAFTGIWVDGYLYLPRWSEGFPVTWELFRGGYQSNLGLWDLFQAARNVSDLRSDQKKQLELPAGIREEKTLPDGYTVVTVNEQRLTVLTREHFATPLVLSDRRTLAIANASGESGMARLFERMVSAAGGAVVDIREGEPQDSWCEVAYSGEATGVVKWLRDRVGCQVKAADWQRARTEVEVVLGKKFGEKFVR